MPCFQENCFLLHSFPSKIHPLGPHVLLGEPAACTSWSGGRCRKHPTCPRKKGASATNTGLTWDGIAHPHWVFRTLGSIPMGAPLARASSLGHCLSQASP
jgi:hypothetical protein